ncbi:CDP-diacylglycerol--glycerol-3-phosphate 3-phosphatidyltransferase [Zavarzinella formosa]|uniref:CDP-diacylglycerol--glycerol-3-phosphate 3-phosphatidyltransferase n=1 Tax=Zavarzinella formosa TaxID=360055 RepID=UPI000312735C|nr:CDP-diacylglycerol--glycerol-3-phosphate 3-phosphatidyltransferase [Zavarzinella formosa]
MAAEPNLWTTPNWLTISRLPLTVLLCLFIHLNWWPAALFTFVIAAITDWIDGWWARTFGQLSMFGRTFDPLTDKVLLGSAFIFLLAVPASGFEPWMTAVVIGRELLVTGLRGYVETLGKKFGADWFGKLKTILQCVTLIAVLLTLWLREVPAFDSFGNLLGTLQFGLIYAMIAATVLSGLQYITKAARLIGAY